MAPKIATYVSHRATHSVNLKQKILSVFVVGSFVIIWLMSLASVFLFIISYNARYIKTIIFIILTTILSYSPWKKGRICLAISNFYFHHHIRYYKTLNIEFEGNALPSPSSSQTLYSVHPHGAFSFGWSLLYSSPIMSHVRFCFSPALFKSPFFRLFSRLVGTPGSAGKSDMIQYLEKGEHLALLPGGFEEATLTSATKDRVFIKKRHGFIRLCLKYGVAVKPVYVFGEKSLFSNIQGMYKFRLGLNRLGIPAILIWGNMFFPLLPKWNKSLYIVVGSPLVLPKISNPSKEEIALWHGKYIDALTKLFEEHKEYAYGEEGKSTKLEVW